MENSGLFKKYTVYQDGEEVAAPTFTLKPITDPAAREAIMTYAAFILGDNPQLYTDLVDWINRIEEVHGKHEWPELSTENDEGVDNNEESNNWDGWV